MQRASSEDELFQRPLTKWPRFSGNVELLEATTAYSQILPRKRRFRGDAASKFHAGFFGGNDPN